MIRKRIDVSVIASLLLLVVILVFFIIMTNGKMVSSFNIKTILDQSVIFIVAGLGALFVVAQGGADLSVGTTLGIATTGSTLIAASLGSEWLVFPVVILIGLAQGLVNGFLVAKMKVPSFMVTLAFLIGMRGFILFVQSKSGGGFYHASGPILLLKNDSVKFTLLVILLIIAYILLSHTKFGEYSKAIGENESVAINVGIPVARMKILAFVMSGIMAAIAGLFMMAKVGGTNNTMGLNMEIDVLMGIFLGGVLVTGGYSAKISKLLIGAFILAIIKNGMIVMGQTTIEVVQSTQGVLLIVILFATIQLKKIQRRTATAKANADKDLIAE